MSTIEQPTKTPRHQTTKTLATLCVISLKVIDRSTKFISILTVSFVLSSLVLALSNLLLPSWASYAVAFSVAFHTSDSIARFVGLKTQGRKPVDKAHLRDAGQGSRQP